MVQNVSNQNSGGYGSINRIGATENGRVIYQITDDSGKVAGNLSVAQKDCDTFEKSYKDIMEATPKLQKYVQTTPPEKMEKMQRLSKWIIAGGLLIGGLIPAIKVKGDGWTGVIKQIFATLLGAGVGLGAGVTIATKTCTPPGSIQFTKASQNLSKIDIQPVQ